MKGAVVAIVMLGTFLSILQGAYWLRHDRSMLDDICWAECMR